MRSFLPVLLLPLATSAAEADFALWKTRGFVPSLSEESALSPDEKLACGQVCDFTVPGSVAEEPEPKAKIVYDGFLPKVELNGRRYDPVFNLIPAGSPYSWNQAIKMRALGIRFHRIDLIRSEVFEKAPGVYDFTQLDVYARQILKCIPDAYLTLGIRISLPKWCAVHPESCVEYADGATETGTGDEQYGRLVRPSAASPAFRAEGVRVIEALGAFVNSKPWGRRVVAVRPSWGVYTEWHVYGMFHAPDVGPAMKEAFHRWQGGRYAGETLPTLSERTPHEQVLLDPIRDAKTRAYYDCLQGEVADCLLLFAHTVKRVLPGRLVGAYYGYVVDAHPPEGATVLLDKVLSSPDIDFLSNPSGYSAEMRRAGGAYAQRTIPATFRRYGKMAVLEDDMRFHHVGEALRAANHPAGRRDRITATPLESRMTMRRDALNCVFDGSGLQFFDPIPLFRRRFCSHDDPDVLDGLKESMDVVRSLGTVPVDSENDTAVVFDWRARLQQTHGAYDNPTCYHLYESALQRMMRTGATFDVLSLDDYLEADRAYSRVVFMDLFHPSGTVVRAVGRRLERDGAQAVRILLPGAWRGAWGSKVQEVEKIPGSLVDWRRFFSDLGAHLYAPEGHYVRRHGNLLLFHTAGISRQDLSLPPDLSGRPATELFSGRRIADGRLTVESAGPQTWLFRFDSSCK